MAFYTMFNQSGSYSAEDMRRLFASFTNSGIVNVDDFLVEANAPNSLRVVVNAGESFINGHYIKSDNKEQINIEANTSGYNRIDTVVLGINPNGDSASIRVLKGTPGSNPQPPNTRDYWEIPLANILVGNNASVITSENISDIRWFGGASRQYADHYTNNIIPKDNYGPTIGNLYRYYSNMYTKGLTMKDPGHDNRYEFFPNSNGWLVGSIGGTSNFFERRSGGDMHFYAPYITMTKGTQTAELHPTELRTNNDYFGIRISPEGGTPYHLWFDHSSQSLYSSDGFVDIGRETDKFKDGYFAGTVSATNWRGLSDKRVKKNIEYISDNKKYYNFVKEIKFAEFDYIETEKHSVGFVAQDLQECEVGNNLINASKDGVLGYDLMSYVNSLAIALQEAIKEIEILKANK